MTTSAIPARRNLRALRTFLFPLNDSTAALTAVVINLTIRLHSEGEARSWTSNIGDVAGLLGNVPSRRDRRHRGLFAPHSEINGPRRKAPSCLGPWAAGCAVDRGSPRRGPPVFEHCLDNLSNHGAVSEADRSPTRRRLTIRGKARHGGRLRVGTRPPCSGGAAESPGRA